MTTTSFLRFILVCTPMLLEACATSGAKTTDVVIRDFTGDASGAEIRMALESKISKLKQFRVIARDPASLELVEQEAVKGKNQDDLFTKKGTGVKLREGLAGTKLIHGSCSRTKDQHNRKVGFFGFPPILGWLLGMEYADKVYTHTAYCKYRVINAENHVQEIAGDADPRSWDSSEENAPIHPDVARSIASEILDNVDEQLKKGGQ